MQWLKDFQWPGNARQLRNFIERLVLICGSKFDHNVFDELYLELFEYRSDSSQSQVERSSQSTFESASFASMPGDIDHAMIRSALEKRGDSRTKVAKLLGISRTTLSKKLKQYDHN